MKCLEMIYVNSCYEQLKEEYLEERLFRYFVIIFLITLLN